MNNHIPGNDLSQLIEEHRTLDEKINEMTLQPVYDQLAVQRMKKRKLQLKDQIILEEEKSQSTSNDSGQQAALRQRLKKLKHDHAQMDKDLTKLLIKPLHDQIAARTLKKRKLYLKEEILKIESMLTPDTLA